jgi:very-short-patch-repair endonuclease
MSHIQWSEEELKKYTDRLASVIYSAPRPLHTPRSLQTAPEKVSPGKAKTGKGSDIEEMLAFQIKAVGLPEPVREYKYIPGRRFRLDFAWPALKFGVEVQGMVHRIKKQFEADIYKRQLGLLAGWKILEVSGKTVRGGQAALWIAQLLKEAEKCG